MNYEQIEKNELNELIRKLADSPYPVSSVRLNWVLTA